MHFEEINLSLYCIYFKVEHKAMDKKFDTELVICTVILKKGINIHHVKILKCFTAVRVAATLQEIFSKWANGHTAIIYNQYL